MAIGAQRSKTTEVWVSVTVDALGTGASQHLLPLSTMAGLAGQLVVDPFYSEGSKVMVDAAVGQPRFLGVTAVAIGPLLPVMDVQMAVDAFLGRTDVLVLEVALLTVEVAVSPKQPELALRIVIESYVLGPSFGRVTQVAGLLELPLVKVVVAVPARRIDGPKMPVLVASGTLQLRMLPLEFESTQAVVEKANLPLLETAMAAVTAYITKLGPVEVDMTEGAVGGGVVLDLRPVGVTSETWLLAVPSLERKSGDPVIEARLLPTHR